MKLLSGGKGRVNSILLTKLHLSPTTNRTEIEKSKHIAASSSWWHASSQVPWKLCFPAHHCSAVRWSFDILTVQMYFGCEREVSL